MLYSFLRYSVLVVVGLIFGTMKAVTNHFRPSGDVMCKILKQISASWNYSLLQWSYESSKTTEWPGIIRTMTQEKNLSWAQYIRKIQTESLLTLHLPLTVAENTWPLIEYCISMIYPWNKIKAYIFFLCALSL